MELAPGVLLTLADGEEVEVITRGEALLPGLVACEVRAAEGPLLLVADDVAAPRELVEQNAMLLRRVRPAEKGRLGPVRASRSRESTTEIGGYREVPRDAHGAARRCLFFSLTPTMMLSRVLTPSTRLAWPWPTVARLGVELAQSLELGPVPSLDPFAMGLDAHGAWILDPALDTLLRADRRSGSSLSGSVAWMGYLAPEQIRRRAGEVSAPDDACARHGLGVLLHELLTGRPLYGRDTPLETLVAIRTGLPPSLVRAVPGIPLDLAACVHGLLDQDPLRRVEPGRVAELLEPLAVPDLAWTEHLFARHARPLDFLRAALRRAS